MGIKNIGKILSLAIILLCILIGSMYVVSAQTLPGNPTPPTSIPTATTSGGGSSGGSGSSGSSGSTAPQVVYPIITVVKNSQGTVIGNVTEESMSQIDFLVAEPITVNGQQVNVQITGDLNSMPSNPVMDILGESNASVPGSLTIGKILASANFTSFSGGWSVISGTVQITITVPQGLIGSADTGKSELVRYDGSIYELLIPTVSGPDANGAYTFTASSPNEGLNGFSEYTLGLVTAALPTPEAIPTPKTSPLPTPPATPAQAPVDNTTILLSGILVVVIAVAAIAGYFLLFRNK
jgi:hypothetical protein